VDVALDVDTGVDDALALLCAIRSPEITVRAVTCVAGNVPVDQAVTNTLKVLDIAGAADVPVARGHERPLSRDGIPFRGIHGADGLADLGLDWRPRTPAAVHAVELLRDIADSGGEPVTILGLGPLTNIADLLRTHPESAARLSRIVYVGGVPCQREPADFNRRFDPEAAAIVTASGLPVLSFGMDVFFDIELSAEDVSRLSTSPDPAARLAGSLMRHQLGRHGYRSATVGDAGAVLCVLEPSGSRTTPVGGELARVSSVDAPALRALFLQTMGWAR
jgi:pyrimidine-specific ribonucleoside hydrolase